MTGDFIEFGTYDTFAEEERGTRTHVLHLCMEKQDLDLYFTHKDLPEDWEVMALEFVPAQRQAISDGRDMLVAEEAEAVSLKNAPTYTQMEVTLGETPYTLSGILTLPGGADKQNWVPACVLVHDQGPWDMDGTLGQTKLLADIADAFAQKGIATLRYEKRTYAHGSDMTQEQLDNLSLEEEVIQDALLGARLLKEQEAIDPSRIVLVGHGLGAMLAPRIAGEEQGLFAALLMIGGTPKPSDPRMAQVDQIKLIQRLKLPTYIVQGSRDGQVAVQDGVEAYEDRLGNRANWVDYATYRGLNRQLMKSAGGGQETPEEYEVHAKLDVAAARNMAAWIQGLWKAE